MNLFELRRHPFTVSLAWSFFIHSVFAVAAMFVVFAQAQEKPHEEVLNFRLKSVDTHSSIIAHKRGAPGALSPALSFGVKTDKPIPARSPLKESTPLSSGKNIEVAPKKLALDESLFGGGYDQNAAIQRTEEKELRDVIALKPKSIEDSTALKRLAVQYGSGVAKSLENLSASVPSQVWKSGGPVNINPEEGMPGFTPSSGSYGNSDLESGPAESQGEVLKYESLDEFLDIQVATYQDPKDSQKYYQIKMSAKGDAKHFHVMPKEILFTIDCSLSMHPDRLEEFKKGITYCLKHFNEGDIFNIVAFKEKVTFFSPQSLPPTPENIQRAEKFVLALKPSDKTDVYQAFRRIVSLPHGRASSSVILLSDGRPTHGVVDSRELINSITRANRGVRPIFAFSGGAKVNRYLLDFIAYQNRAWSQFMKKTWDIRKGLAEFYDKIRHPIFLNLRYRLNGLDEKEVFPKSLPDFYRDAEFNLYGTYRDQDKFSMQLLGDVDGKTKELIFTRSFAEAAKGSEEIKRGYAFNKIYDRISQVTVLGPKAETLKEIADLSARYGITTPYSPELQNTD